MGGATYKCSSVALGLQFNRLASYLFLSDDSLLHCSTDADAHPIVVFF